MSGAHARLSASSAYRWFACPGSVGGEDKPSRYAAEGTFAHSIAADCFALDCNASSFIGRKGTVEGFDFVCDAPMVEAIQVYLDAVRDDLKSGDWLAHEVSLEKYLTALDPDFGGTADYVRYRASTRSLKVFDFKFGAGVFVEPTSNKQMMMYAVGAMLAVRVPVDEVEVIIVQPRIEWADPVRPWKFKAFEILDFIADAQEAAKRTREPNPALVAGDHCKFCPKSRGCPELERHQHALVKAEFDAALPYDVKALSTALASVAAVKERIRAIEAFAYAEALKGVEIPGFKLVEKRPTRKWKSEGDLIEWAQANAIDPFAPREVLSPAQLEAKLKATAARGKKKEVAAVVAPFIESVSSGTALVPVTDERQPVKQITAEDFA